MLHLILPGLSDLAFFWPDPEEFKPDRFIDTDDYKYNRDAFLPFSAGARSCVGRKFAEIELVCESCIANLENGCRGRAKRP